ncbi:MAG TPA: hypothetical protein VN660_13590 [Steroidobacteraceae bacterium]|nr:hypothetical protein [Steroidobacteraceae bacterium]
MPDDVRAAGDAGFLGQQIEEFTRRQALSVIRDDLVAGALPAREFGGHRRSDRHRRPALLRLTPAIRIEPDPAQSQIDLAPGELAQRGLARCGADRQDQEAPPVLARVLAFGPGRGRGVEQRGQVLDREGVLAVSQDRLPVRGGDLLGHDELGIVATVPVHRRPDAIEAALNRPV